MPSPVGHSLISLSIACLFDRNFKLNNLKFLLFIFMLAILPDLDLLPILLLGLEKGVKYHQLYTHNILFALIVGGVVYTLSKNKRNAFIAFIIILFHILADILVTDYKEPIGVPIFYPFWGKTLSLGLIPGIDKGGLAKLFSIANFQAILIEIALFFPLFIVVLLLKKRNLKKLIFYDMFFSNKK